MARTGRMIIQAYGIIKVMGEKLAGSEGQVTTQAPTERPGEELPTPVVEQKPKVNKFVILGGILGFLIFAGAIFGAYRLGQRQTQPTPEIAATPTPDPAADWQTYTNEQGGYEIKYPEEGEIEEVGEPEKFMCIHISIGQAFLRIKTPKGAYGGCIVTGVDDPAESIQEIVEILKSEQTASGMKTVSGAEYQEFFRIEDIGGTEGFILEYGRSYDESANYESNQADKEKIYLMLSTFKLLDSSGLSSMLGWQTYTNTKHGYSAKYPREWFVEEKDDLTKIYNQDPNIHKFERTREISPGVFDYPTEDFIFDMNVVENIMPDPGLAQKSSIEIGGLDGIRGVLTGGEGEKILMGNVVKNGKTYNFYGRPADSNNKDTFDLILSTFRFLD